MGEIVTYVADTAPEFKTNLSFGKGDDRERVLILFHNKQLKLDSETDAHIIEELDRLIIARPQFSQVIRKLDVEAAERLAIAHQEAMLKQNAGHTGPVTSANELALRARMEEEKQRYLSQGMSDEEASRLVHDVMQEQTVTVEKVDPDIAAAAKDSVFQKLTSGK